MTDECVRSVRFADAAEKAAWLDAAARLDARLPVTREIARRIVRPFGPAATARTYAIHRYVRDAIRYVSDPGCEEFSDSDLVLRRGFGDCDDKARAFVALCTSVGLAARIVPVHRGPAFVHVAAEVKLHGAWVYAELIIKGAELGDRPAGGPLA